MLFKACKIRGQKERGLSGTAKDRNLKFGAPIDFDECYSTHAKLGTKGAWPKSRDLLLIFGTPSISPERLKLET